MQFPPTFNLLQQEGHLVASMLAHGLTSLRSSGCANKGALYSASFQLCIGIERMMKLVIVLDHMASNALRPPTAKAIQDFSHDFRRLITATRAISANVKGDPIAAALAPSLNQEIMEVIGMFGRGDVRYFNIEALALASNKDDPLVRWHLLFDRIVASDVSERKKAKAQFCSATIGAVIDRVGMVIRSDLRGAPLSGETMVERTVLEDEAARYATYRVIQILDAVRAVLVARCYQCIGIANGVAQVPYLNEFFYFINAEKEFALNKRRWIAPG